MSDTETEVPEWFRRRMTWLFSLFPSSHSGGAVIAGYWQYLRRIRRAALEHAIAKAPHGREWLPPAPVIEGLAMMEQRRLEQLEAEQREPLPALPAAPPESGNIKKSRLDQECSGLTGAHERGEIDTEQLLRGIAAALGKNKQM